MIFLVKYDLYMLFTSFLRFTLTNLPMTEFKWPVTCKSQISFTLINVLQAVLFQLSDAVQLTPCLSCMCVQMHVRQWNIYSFYHNWQLSTHYWKWSFWAVVFLFYFYYCVVVLVSCGTLSVSGLESSLLSHDYCAIYIFMYSNVFSYIWGCQRSPGILNFIFSV